MRFFCPVDSVEKLGQPVDSVEPIILLSCFILQLCCIPSPSRKGGDPFMIYLSPFRGLPLRRRSVQISCYTLLCILFQKIC